MAVYVTGDIHGNPTRLSKDNFYEQKDFSGNKVIHHHHCGRTDFGDHIVDAEKIGSQPHTQFVHSQSYNTQQDKDYELAAFIGIFIGLKYKRNT